MKKRESINLAPYILQLQDKEIVCDLIKTGGFRYIRI